jgi:hypothetical protein
MQHATAWEQAIDRLVCRRAASPLRFGYALYLPSLKLRRASGLTPAEIKLVEEA